MADNPVVDNGTLTDITFAGDDIGGVIHQRVKISVGADGSGNDTQPPYDSIPTTAVLPAGALVWNAGDSTWRMPRSGYADGVSGTVVLGAVPMLYNGTEVDRQRGNIEGTLLASAARTTSTTTAVQTNHNHRGVVIFLNITAASGTGGLQARIRYVDPVSSVPVVISAAPTAITATGMYAYALYPGVSSAIVGSGGLQRVESAVLPRSWDVTVTHGDASSYTYSLGYSLVV